MMTREERDALIDATVAQCAKIAETYLEQVESSLAQRTAGRLIAAEIRKQFRK